MFNAERTASSALSLRRRSPDSWHPKGFGRLYLILPCAELHYWNGSSSSRFSLKVTVMAVSMANTQRAFDTKAFLARVGDGRTIGSYAADQPVFRQGDPGDAVFYIQKGRVKITVLSEQGKEAVVALLGRTAFFGEGCLAGQSSRISSAVALSDSVISRIERATIVRLIHDEPDFSEMFIAHLLGRAVRVEADLIDQLFNSSEKRLARLLLLLAKFGKDSDPEPMIAKISQETLAQMIGTTRARVSFFMNKFRKLGFISYNGNIEVHPSLLNAVLHDDPHIER